MSGNGLNRAILCGNLGMDPELRFTNGGQAVLRMRLATTESYVDKSGERQERTDWHTVILWGKRAEALNKILSKGKTIWVEGRIQTRSWDKDGVKHYATEINASDIGLLGSGKQSDRSSDGQREREPGDDDESSEMPDF